MQEIINFWLKIISKTGAFVLALEVRVQVNCIQIVDPELVVVQPHGYFDWCSMLTLLLVCSSFSRENLVIHYSFAHH